MAADQQAQSSGLVVPSAFAAPLLDQALEGLRAGRRLTVLDLGPARAVTINSLGQYPCRVGVADALFQLAGGEGAADDAALASLLPEHWFADTQLFLVWDLPEYLSTATLQRFAQRLTALAAPGARLHALVAYRGERIPSQPVGYEMGADGIRPLAPAMDDPGRVPARISSDALQKGLPGWHLERSVLLRNGLQEYLFAC